MILVPHINKLLDSDILGWHDDQPSHCWVRVLRGRRPWERKLRNINGLHIRLRWWGLCFHFGSGVYGRHSIAWGPFKAVVYRHDTYQQWLESWMGY